MEERLRSKRKQDTDSTSYMASKHGPVIILHASAQIVAPAVSNHQRQRSESSQTIDRLREATARRIADKATVIGQYG